MNSCVYVVYWNQPVQSSVAEIMHNLWSGQKLLVDSIIKFCIYDT